MSGDRFEGSWLALREAADHRARAGELLDPLAEAWREGRWSRVVDLGAGTGSNLRYLAPRLPGPQRWTLVDHDAALLEETRRGEPPRARDGEEVSLEVRVGDLVGEGLADVEEAELVTASALLDLVTEEWLEALARRCAAAGAAALLALTWDGSVRWSPPAHPDDARTVEAVVRHQRTDKGMGPALGPDGAAVAERLFRDAGYRTRLRPSPWVLGAADAPLVEALVTGWEEAAVAVRPDEAERIRAWARHRRRPLGDGTLTVGHLDLLALP